MTLSRISTFCLASVLTLSSLASSCAMRSSDSTQEAIVTLGQYQRAYSIIKGVDYLPFAVTRDGCYARALYMSMELAAEKIQSSSTFALAQPGTVLRLNNGTTWRYHVAPMLQVPGYATMIIDPSMASEPIRQDQWLAAMSGQGASVYSIPGSYYGYWYGSAVYPSNIISSFDAMPAFRVEDIKHACQTAYKYIGEENASASEIAAKRQKMINRTVALGQAMANVGKLTNASGIRSYDCQSAPYP